MNSLATSLIATTDYNYLHPHHQWFLKQDSLDEFAQRLCRFSDKSLVQILKFIIILFPILYVDSKIIILGPTCIIE
jgi:hypothetical protein